MSQSINTYKQQAQFGFQVARASDKAFVGGIAVAIAASVISKRPIVKAGIFTTIVSVGTGIAGTEYGHAKYQRVFEMTKK